VPAVIRVSKNASEKEKLITRMIKELLSSYFEIVKKRIADSVPKTIVTFLVLRACEGCEAELIKNLYKESSFDELFRESEYITKSRKDCKDMVSMLRGCLDVLIEIEQ